MTDQLYCPKCGPNWHGAYDMNHRCVECGVALKAEKLMEKLKAVEEERDALLAHVERLTDAACSEGAGPMMRSAIDENPTTTLARLIAEWQAEALDQLLYEGRDAREADTMRAFARNRIRSLLRHEENHPATPCPDGGKCYKRGDTCGDPICVEWHADLAQEPQS